MVHDNWEEADVGKNTVEVERQRDHFDRLVFVDSDVQIRYWCRLGMIGTIRDGGCLGAGHQLEIDLLPFHAFGDLDRSVQTGQTLNSDVASWKVASPH